MKTKTFTKVAMIAAIYTVLTLVLAPISYGNMQVRISESLTMLPLIYTPSIYGVTLGCFLSNLIGAMTGVNPTGYIDAIVGTLATFLAAYFTYKAKDNKFKNVPVISMLMPIVFNFFFVGAELGYLFMPDNFLLGMVVNGAWVALGEVIAVIIGFFLVKGLDKTEIFKK